MADRSGRGARRSAARRLKKIIFEFNGFIKGDLPAGWHPLSQSVITKINTLLEYHSFPGEYQGIRIAAKSLADRIITELIGVYQLLSLHDLCKVLWAAIRARGCQFLGPSMQEEILKLILLAFEDGTALSRKIIVLFVVQRLQNKFPQTSKTSVGHVVQLLYRASCFTLIKRSKDSALMRLKEEFRSYPALRREHDRQIVEVAMESGIRISPDQWSSILYGDSLHRSHMQSIVAKVHTSQTISKAANELLQALKRVCNSYFVCYMSERLEILSSLDTIEDNLLWRDLSPVLEVLIYLIEFLAQSPKYQTLKSAIRFNHDLDDIPESFNDTSFRNDLINNNSHSSRNPVVPPRLQRLQASAGQIPFAQSPQQALQLNPHMMYLQNQAYNECAALRQTVNLDFELRDFASLNLQNESRYPQVYSTDMMNNNNNQPGQMIIQQKPHHLQLAPMPMQYAPCVSMAAAPFVTQPEMMLMPNPIYGRPALIHPLVETGQMFNDESKFGEPLTVQIHNTSDPIVVEDLSQPKQMMMLPQRQVQVQPHFLNMVIDQPLLLPPRMAMMGNQYYTENPEVIMPEPSELTSGTRKSSVEQAPVDGQLNINPEWPDISFFAPIQNQPENEDSNDELAEEILALERSLDVLRE